MDGSLNMEAIRKVGSGSRPDLAADQLAIVTRLESRDAAVRRHEAAHLAAAGGLAQGGARFTYQLGPNGRPYATGGEVNIDTSPARTPEETLAKAYRIRAAATAPDDPSAQDLAVAARASQMAMQAQQQIAQRAARATLLNHFDVTDSLD